MSITPPCGGTTATGARKHPHTHALVLQILFQAGGKGRNGSPEGGLTGTTKTKPKE